jgi:hypothetical protein
MVPILAVSQSQPHAHAYSSYRGHCFLLTMWLEGTVDGRTDVDVVTVVAFAWCTYKSAAVYDR